MPAMTQSAQSLGVCVYLWQLRFMDVGVKKHRQTFLDWQRAWQLDQIDVLLPGLPAMLGSARVAVAMQAREGAQAAVAALLVKLCSLKL